MADSAAVLRYVYRTELTCWRCHRFYAAELCKTNRSGGLATQEAWGAVNQTAFDWAAYMLECQFCEDDSIIKQLMNGDPVCKLRNTMGERQMRHFLQQFGASS